LLSGVSITVNVHLMLVISALEQLYSLDMVRASGIEKNDSVGGPISH